MQHATCNMLACNMQHASMQHTACNMQHAAYSIQHTTCSIQHTAYNIQHTAYSIQHASMQHARNRARTRSPCACDVEACGCEAAELGDGRRRDRWVVAEDVKERKILRLQPRLVTHGGSASAGRPLWRTVRAEHTVGMWTEPYELELVRAVDTTLTPKSKSRSIDVRRQYSQGD